MDVATRTRTDGKAVVSVVLAVASLLALTLPVLSVMLSIAAIVVALQCRQSLRRNPELGGTSLSLLAFVVGLAALVFVSAPFVIAVVVQFVGGALSRAF